MSNEIKIYQGNTKTTTCFVEDSSGTPYNLTGYGAVFYATKYRSRLIAPPDLSINYTTIDATNGAIIFNFSTTDTSLNTGDYVYEVIIDNATNRISVLQDTLSILDSVNK